jgi:Flp pilus assembly protein protease CpaA
MPPSLAFLKWLVILLTLSMIGGVITVVWLLVTRMPLAMGRSPAVPAELALPAGETAEAVTFGRGWTAVVTGSGRILVFNTDGSLRQEVTIIAEPAP